MRYYVTGRISGERWAQKEYTEPVRKILLGLPESVLQELDQYANQCNLSRPKQSLPC